MDLSTLLFAVAAMLAGAAAALLPNVVPNRKTALLLGAGFGLAAIAFVAVAVLAFVSRPPAPPQPLAFDSRPPAPALAFVSRSPAPAAPPQPPCDPSKQLVVSNGYISSNEGGVLLKHGASACFENTTIKARVNALTAEGR